MTDTQISFGNLLNIIGGLRYRRSKERLENSNHYEDKIAEPGKKYLRDLLTGGMDALDEIKDRVRIQLLGLKKELDNFTEDDILKDKEEVKRASERQLAIINIFEIIDEMLELLKKDRASKPFIMDTEGNHIELEENEDYIPVDYVRDYIFNTRTGGIEALTELKNRLTQGKFDRIDITI